MDARRRPQRGFTTVELLVTMGIAALLVAMTLPGFEHVWRTATLGSGANQMVGALHRARSAAILRNLPVVVCLTSDGSTCLSAPGEPGSGWLVFLDLQRGVPPRFEPSDELLLQVRLPQRLSIRGTRPAITYWPTTRGGTTGTFLVCDSRSRASGRAVVISQTGRPRNAGAAPCPL